MDSKNFRSVPQWLPAVGWVVIIAGLALIGLNLFVVIGERRYDTVWQFGGGVLAIAAGILAVRKGRRYP